MLTRTGAPRVTVYALRCGCGAEPEPVAGAPAAAAMLRAHPCPPHLAGPYAEPVRCPPPCPPAERWYREHGAYRGGGRR